MLPAPQNFSIFYPKRPRCRGLSFFAHSMVAGSSFATSFDALCRFFKTLLVAPLMFLRDGRSLLRATASVRFCRYIFLPLALPDNIADVAAKRHPPAAIRPISSVGKTLANSSSISYYGPILFLEA